MNIRQYTIGRGDECQIRIQDSTQRVSRDHATLKVLSNGKIFIVDHSTNGTFVNGIKISKNVDYPIKYGDSVSFANVAELNWALIPKQTNKTIIYVIITVTIIILGLVFVKIFIDRQKEDVPVLSSVDSTEIRCKKKEYENIVKDSIKHAKRDSLLKAKDEQLKDAKKKLKEKEEDAKKAKEAEEKAKEEEKKDTIIIM